jgi:predicted nucleotidyltransferase component of viral defense system
MITKSEIEAKSEAFGIHISNVERDYVFGWLLCAIYSASQLGRILVLKGGNCFRKGYFANTSRHKDRYEKLCYGRSGSIAY